MNKGLLLKVFLLFVLFFQLVNKAQAQYAISGTAPNGLPSKVYWLTWNTANFQKVIDGGGPGISYPSGFIDKTGSGSTPGGSVLPGNYIWQYSPTVRIKATIAPFTAATGGLLQPYTPGEFFTDGLDLMFSGNGIQTKALTQAANGTNPTSTAFSRGVPYSALANEIGPGQIQFNISINVEILIGGIWTDTPYPGMVIADAESMAAGELIQAITESSGVGAIGWQLIGFRKGDKPTGVSDGNQNNDYKVTLSTAPGSTTPASQIALQVNGAGNYNTQGVFYAHGVKALKNVTVRGAGKTAIAIGFVMPFDMGDAKNYTKVGAYINGFNTANNIVPANAVDKGVSTIAVTPLEPLANVYLGNNTVVDADGDNVLDETASTDDNTTSPGIDDEDSVDPNAISPLKVNASGDVSAQITKVTNGNASATAKVYAWIDFDGNGKFNEYEVSDLVTPINPSTSTSSPITLNFSRSLFGTHIKAGTTKMRVRVTTNSLTDNDASTVDGRSETYTGDGEVEDYQVIIPGITVSGSVFHDPTGSGTGTLISSVGTPAQALKAYLVKGSVIKQKVSVSVGGTYTFTNVDNGTDYKILLSIKDVDVNTATVSDITTGAMPAGWGSSGDFFGLNNLLSSSQGTNIKDGTNNLQVLLSTPIAGQDVTLVNFSLTQLPEAKNDAVSTNIGAVVQIPVLNNTTAGTVEDTDPDGSIFPATVLIMDPVDNIYKSSVTTTKGVYSVANTGIVTFTPATGFVGKATVNYTVKDNGGATSNVATITIDVKPTGQPDADVTTIGTPKTTNVISGTPSGTDSPGTTPPSAGATTITDIVKSANASTVVASGNNITYTPVAGFVGKDTYTYRLTTSDGIKSDPITVTIDVKPTGQPDADVTTIGTPKTTNVISGTPSGTDSPGTTPPSAGATTITDITPTSNALTVVVSGTNSIIYTPKPGFVGTDTYTYRLTTSDGVKSDPITVTINVVETILAGVNDVDYVASYKKYKINGTDVTETATQVTTDVTTNDPDGGGATTITNVSIPSNGTAVVSGKSITYTPNANFIGTDTYTYKLNNGNGSSNDITVTIHVSGITLAKKVTNSAVINSAGETINYEFKVKNVGPVTLTNVVVTDAGVDANSILPSPNIGSLAANTEVTLTAKYTVKSADVAAGKYSNQATVTAKDPKSPTPNNITSKSDNPSIISTNIDTNPYDPTEVTIIPLPAAISLAKTGVQAGNNINYTFTITNTGTTNLNSVTLTDAKLGLAAVTVNVPNGGVLIPGASVTYNAVYALTSADKTAGSVSNTATVNAKDPGNNTITKDGSTVTTVLTGVDDNDKTPVNTPVTTNVKTNTNGNDGVSGTGATVNATSGSHGTTVVNTDGSVTYTPANGYIGDDTYTYTLTKGGGTSAPITVTINVYSATMSLSKVANNGATKAGDVINYTLIVKNTGTVPLTNINITDPKADAGSISPASIASLAVGASATITANHTVVAADVTAGTFSNQATATAKDPKDITVSKISDDPATTPFDDPTIVPITPAAPASINLAKTGVFAGNQVTYTFIITNNGGVPLNTITLTDPKLGLSNISIPTPNGLSPNQSVTYNATYTLTQADKDLGAVNNTATVSAKDPSNNTVTGTGSAVNTVPTSPVAVNDVAETNADTPEIISVLTNDNPGNSTFNLTSVEVVASPLHGTVVINPNGTIAYAPNTGYVGNDSFTYKVKDAYGYVTNIATVNITVKEVKELKIPTLFSPNGDGVNDGFVIKDLEDYAQNELVVINRWGNEVYRQADYKNNWSGTGLNEGTYFYIVRLKKSNGESWVVRKGYVTLIRTFRK
ncbi:MAG: tandem-95 repeat protein [Sphingobacteriaceae bacterium]|nr:MAG: tandem-95 repeat protein [Sphingobacteriaceae bacterium]